MRAAEQAYSWAVARQLVETSEQRKAYIYARTIAAFSPSSPPEYLEINPITTGASVTGFYVVYVGLHPGIYSN